MTAFFITYKKAVIFISEPVVFWWCIELYVLTENSMFKYFYLEIRLFLGSFGNGEGVRDREGLWDLERGVKVPKSC